MTLHVHKDLLIASMTLQWLRTLLRLTKFERTFLERGQICRLSWTPIDQNAFSFRGLRPPDPLTRGSAPGPHWRICPQTPVIGSCSALAMVPPNH